MVHAGDPAAALAPGGPSPSSVETNEASGHVIGQVRRPMPGWERKHGAARAATEGHS